MKVILDKLSKRRGHVMFYTLDLEPLFVSAGYLIVTRIECQFFSGSKQTYTTMILSSSLFF